MDSFLEIGFQRKKIYHKEEQGNSSKPILAIGKLIQIGPKPIFSEVEHQRKKYSEEEKERQDKLLYEFRLCPQSLCMYASLLINRTEYAYIEVFINLKILNTRFLFSFRRAISISFL